MHIDPSKIPDVNKVKAELCKRRFFKFFCEFWETIEATKLELNWHIEYICDELQVIYETWEAGESQPDVLLNVPPGSSKSTIVTQLFPAWLWVKNPSIRVISSSYANDLSTSHAVKTRDCLKSDKFLLYFPGHIKFKEDSDGKTNYKNTKKGERFVTSTGGRVTGMHGDFILNDDPINPEQSAGEAELLKATRFSSRTLSTRKTNKKRTVTIMIMQRLHDLDPSGDWIKKKKKLNHICLPGRVSNNIKPEYLKDKYIDGLLDPNRLDNDALAKMEEDLGSYGFSGQVMQQPSPEGGGIWKKWIIAIPDHLMPERIELVDYGSDWDTAYTEKAGNASSAYIISGVKNNKMYIDNFGFFNLEFPELIEQMVNLPSPHYIEAKASGKSAKQTLTRAGIVAIEVEVNSDKVARARDATPKAQAGMVYCRASILDKLYNDSEQGILKFPNGRKQDLADTLAQAIQRHFGLIPIGETKAKLPYVGKQAMKEEIDYFR
ncbi:MAG TPA: hypothetical protein VN922_24640 [Bacteroidia bacterium]|nr:hypothetical protein [Bacteroidia bacterium]